MNEEEILKETEKLEGKLMTLGLNGLAYTPIWNITARKLQKLKEISSEEGI